MTRMILGALIAALALGAQTREVAITIDDLPRGGGDRAPLEAAAVREMTAKLLAPLRGIPVIGFVNACRGSGLGEAGLDGILAMWVANGADLGNHTCSHPDLNTTPFEEYTADLERGEPAVTRALGHRPVYFRHPFLHTGPVAEKREGLARFLAARGYTVAPVTLDNSDWMFAAIYVDALARKDTALAEKVRREYVPYMESIFAFFEVRGKEVAGHDFPQILLIHASRLNADMMPELLAMMRRRGYRFVSLGEALRDDAYRLPEAYTGTGGFSWIHRWSKTMGMKPKGEPDEPAWVTAAYGKLTR
ncbi:MAG: polysaccharide deacetylase family protein [Acidobacteriota bacterium]|nr:polysaccharide deacetylase family protein [Acidobacteriota bacterium]